MQTKVYKYPLAFDDLVSFSMPRGALPLCVRMQAGAPQLWALVDPEAPLNPRTFRIAGTGDPIAGDVRYIDSFTMEGGFVIFHVFEVLG